MWVPSFIVIVLIVWSPLFAGEVSGLGASCPAEPLHSEGREELIALPFEDLAGGEQADGRGIGDARMHDRDIEAADTGSSTDDRMVIAGGRAIADAVKIHFEAIAASDEGLHLGEERARRLLRLCAGLGTAEIRPGDEPTLRRLAQMKLGRHHQAIEDWSDGFRVDEETGG